MKRFTTVAAALATVTLFAATAFASGEDVFKAKCMACHPNGGNIMKKEKTLSGKDLAANKLNTTKALVKYMRNPGPGMTKFDAKALPEKDAKAVAEYILKAFK
ncbi:c-type cytochrome [Geomobilimonas luticola]|uniref:C-type cytochrome n=1 Tax=Geomobilimonas luticola TaxID=1114878 RepID=A0ABS5S8Z3_9BACT|nr:c-type cytochrome [Geomobilimonas luticola]MBT0651620.1 c-type cytochrome [Geomobilimonas luticola]